MSSDMSSSLMVGRKTKEPSWSYVVPLLKKGMRPPQIAALTGKAPGVVRTHISRAKKAGWLSAQSGDTILKTRNNVMGYVRGAQVECGYLVNSMARLSVDQMNWLLKNTPKDGTIADVVVSMVIDAYAEEHT